MKITVARKGQLFLIVSFAALVAIGTLLLLLPGILKEGSLSFIDALFMACSATCLNGLATVPLTEFTFGGQLIILTLIQFGTLGILSLSAMVLLVIGKGLSFSDTLLINSVNDSFTLRGTESLTRTIVNYTLATEAIGALLLLPGFLFSGEGFFLSCWYSIYFSIGSFCNAGLGPLPESVASLNRYSQFICMILMIMGGLGVYAIYDLRQYFQKKVLHLTLHTHIVLRMAAVLIFSGAALLWILSHTDNETVTLGIFDSFFLSVSGRTTGYSTVDPGELSSACQILLIVLMLIGGAPGSAAGGMKTTTIAVVFAALAASFHGENSVIIRKRTIDLRTVLRAFTVMVLFILMTWAGTVVLKSLSPDLTSAKCFFESASALSATGLSTGDTTLLWGTGCKLLLILFMFTGRLGPVTILLFFVGKEKKESLRYPEERIIVG